MDNKDVMYLTMSGCDEHRGTFLLDDVLISNALFMFTDTADLIGESKAMLTLELSSRGQSSFSAQAPLTFWAG